MLVGRLRVGAVLSSTATVAVPVSLVPAPSVAGEVMVVLPSAKVVPEAGEQIGVSEPDTASVAVAVKMTTAPLGPVDSTRVGAVMVTTGGVVSVTLTVKLAFAALPCVWVAVRKTVVRPR